ncbi:MAG: MAPEG family protein [Pseudomonadales bacterium]|nr:MAPEG family protein [Pseudomonadales bacterium]
MIDMILLSLVLLLVQLLLPSVVALAGGHVSVAYLFSSRDEAPGTTALVQRTQRACGNLLETLPAFLVLAVLSLMQGSQVLAFAQGWLVLRVLYLGFYLTGTAYVRSFVWVCALGCLIGMALPLF